MNLINSKNLARRIGGTPWAMMKGALVAMALTPLLATAGTVYSYTGNNYNSCAGNYCTGGPYALSATFGTTLTGSALDNLPFTDITSTITFFQFSDGSGLVVQNSSPGYTSISIATDASGNITAWLAGGYSNSSQIQIQTNWHSPYGFINGADFSETTASFAGSYGFVGNDPGVWAAAPEPSAVALLGVGLLCLVGRRTIGRRPWQLSGKCEFAAELSAGSRLDPRA